MCVNTARNELSCDKRLLVINGSPHHNGTTSRLVRSFLDTLPEDIKTISFSCFDRLPLPCDDCRFCHRADGCSKHDLDEFYTLLENADFLLFACPVYNRSFPAPMKALIDRLQRYWAARFVRRIRPPIARPKRAALLTVCGGSEPEGVHLEQQLRPALTVLHTTLTAAVHACGTDTDEQLLSYGDAVRAAARVMID